METENLSTAASRLALRSATELVGDKEPRPAKPTAVATVRQPNMIGTGKKLILIFFGFIFGVDLHLDVDLWPVCHLGDGRILYDKLSLTRGRP